MTAARDWAGQAFAVDGIFYRQINQAFAAEFDAFERSALFGMLTQRRWILPHREASRDLARDEGCHRVVRPEQVDFISYPYEWSFEQLRAAALVTLDIQQLALTQGFTLRDASAYNVQFIGTNPILIDTLSIGMRSPEAPWMAYRQFCEHFLVPLALMSTISEELRRLHASFADGVPLSVGARTLRGRYRCAWGLHWHVRFHAALQNHSATWTQSRRRHATAVSTRTLDQLCDSLRSTIASLKVPGAGPATWTRYEETLPYNENAIAFKRSYVSDVLRTLAPQRVWDCGANVGDYSRLAETGTLVIAMDGDPRCVGRHFEALKVRDRGANCGGPTILPLAVDLLAPSASGGAAGTERLSLAERGPVDVVLALALIHHLVAAGTSLRRIADQFAAYSRGVMIVEFILPDDPAVATLRSDTPESFRTYSQASFESAFEQYFTVDEALLIPGTHRILYRMRRRIR